MECMSAIRTFPARVRSVLLVAAAWAALTSGVAADARGSVAVVVHASNPMSEISSVQLRHIFLGDQTRWSDNQKVTILLLPRGSNERRTVLMALLKMSEDDFARHWIAKIFRGDVTSGPKTGITAASILKLTADLPAALGVLDADDVPAGTTGVKVLRIDGKVPGDEEYPFVR
jgi:ABC-type phosphate transport system substrate-binding protein